MKKIFDEIAELRLQRLWKAIQKKALADRALSSDLSNETKT